MNMESVQMDLRTELLHFVGPQIQPFCGPLYLATSLKSAEGTIEASGSFGLVDTGERKVLVTCDHVLEEFEALRREKSELVMGVCLDRGNPLVLKPDWLIDRNTMLDLVTFDAGPLLDACQGRQFYELHRRPPPKLSKGDKLVLHGYPGGRRVGSASGLEFGRVTFDLSVADASEFRFVADVSNVMRIEPNRTPALADPYGGASGSPVFLRKPDAFLRLAGFTISYGLNMLTFTHASCLRPDGTLSESRID